MGGDNSRPPPDSNSCSYKGEHSSLLARKWATKGKVCQLTDTFLAIHHQVDESLDRLISYQEFSLMYRRIRQTDPVGLEPRKLFVVCDYMMNDKNGDGVVAMDEAVQLMFMRHGKSFSQDEIKSLFRNANAGGKITFADYLDYTERQYEAIAQKREEEKAKAIKGRPKGRVSKPGQQD